MKLFDFLKRFVPHVYVGNKTGTLAVTLEEGGMWYEFPLHMSRRGGLQIHSILFEDGSTWDAVGGWRTGKYARVDCCYIRRHDGAMHWWRAPGGRHDGFSSGFVPPSKFQTYG